ncbi:HPr family phosphocarrier protein [Microbacterium sp. ZW T5_56]|uniref:HPr family phosphocarrier protein n=1 Tax=Microbacterium sp. ZW T5_56 TaxID=3378081 RepID=UPI0038543A80
MTTLGVATEVVLGQDLHARPAAAVAAHAAAFPGTVLLRPASAPELNAASVLTLMAADLRAGTSVTVSARGVGAADIVTAIVAELAATA